MTSITTPSIDAASHISLGIAQDKAYTSAATGLSGGHYSQDMGCARAALAAIGAASTAWRGLE